MAKLILDPVSNLQNEQSALGIINGNSDRIETAFENTISRNGASPNEMNANLDMNNNRIYNLPEPVGDTEPLRVADASAILDLVDEFEEVIEATEGAVQAYENIQALYLGTKTSFPTTDNLGNPLQEGALFNLVDQPDPEDDKMYVWHSGTWQPVGVLPAAFEKIEVLTVASDGQTNLVSPAGYNPANVKVFRNGVFQIEGDNLGIGDGFADVTANDGTNLVWPANVLEMGERIVLVSAQSFAIADISAGEVDFTPAGGVSATTVQGAIVELDTEKVNTSRSIGVGGLATGGGDLSADRTITVTKSSNAQAIAGVDDSTAMTPLRVKEAITAAGGSPAQSLISSGAPGAVGSIDIALTGGWREYQLLVDLIEPVTATQGLIARLSFDNASTFVSGSSDYKVTGTYIDEGGSVTGWNSTGTTSFLLGRTQPSISGLNGMLDLKLSLPTTSGDYTLAQWVFSHSFTGPLLTDLRASGRCVNSSDRPTHIRLLYPSGNIGSTVRWQLYGLRN